MREHAPKTAFGQTTRGSLPLPILWVSTTLLFCAVFAFVSVHRTEAQGRTEDGRRYIAIIQNVFDFIQRHYVDEVDPRILYEGAMSGMLEALKDPYTSFLTEADMSGLRDTTQGSFGGVGLYITKPAQPEGSPAYVEVASPIEGTPGWRAGIHPGDLIVEINGESTEKLTMEEVLARLRGVPGTQVTILIRRGQRVEFPVTLTRAIIEVPTVRHAMIGNDVGYLRITTFTPMTVDRVREALTEFRSKGLKALVIDLRNNYGGLLQSAVGVADFFLEGGVVVSTKSRIPSENSVFTAGRTALVPLDVPIVVLINRGSASASEIVAGALKDRGRAYLVGEKTFGKGSVQQVYPVGTSGFKLTTARYFTPSDVDIDKIGIPPDREVQFPELTDQEADALNRLIRENRIPAFVAEEGAVSVESTEAFVRELSTQYGLGVSLLRRLIRDERNRAIIAPVYDLEYDIQLKAAVDILRDGSYPALMRAAKSLRTLQEEAAALAAQSQL